MLFQKITSELTTKSYEGQALAIKTHHNIMGSHYKNNMNSFLAIA
jgi:hypothetical protein